MDRKIPNRETHKSRLSDQITNRLKQVILDGKLKPGDRLPPEEKIAKHFRVSKVALREALRAMETEGLIEKHRGIFGGSFVSAPGLARIGDSVSNCYQFGSLTPEELAEFRQVIEPAIIELAITRRTEEDLGVMRNNIEACEAALKNGAPDVYKHVEFHQLLANACHNSLISAVMQAVTQVFVDIIIKLESPLESFRADLDFSRWFYDCLICRDTAKAKKLMFNHFELTKEILNRPKKGQGPQS